MCRRGAERRLGAPHRAYVDAIPRESSGAPHRA